MSSKRNRDREDAGKSDRSYIKQNFLRSIVRSQANAYRWKHRGEQIVLIDGNAGDGEGVPLPQQDLFDDQVSSRPTPQIVTEVADEIGGADVLLCECDKAKRQRLAERFPRAVCLKNNSDVVAHIRPEHRYALWLSDPCGPRDHGVETMRLIVQRPGLRSDFVIAFNQGFIERLEGTHHDDWEPSRCRYLPMGDLAWWAEQLGKTRVARSRLIKQSNGFRFHVLIVANHLADIARPPRFDEWFTAPPALRVVGGSEVHHG